MTESSEEEANKLVYMNGETVIVTGDGRQDVFQVGKIGYVPDSWSNQTSAVVQSTFDTFDFSPRWLKIVIIIHKNKRQNKIDNV